MNIGQKIKLFREKKGITQQHLAEMMNVSTQAVSKWETGASYPDLALIPLLAEYFNVSCDALLTDSGKNERETVNELINAGKQEFVTETEFFEYVESLEDALERYPRSNKLMLTLSYAYSSVSDNSKYREHGWKKKIIDYCERVFSNSEDLQEKYSAMTLLCYTYNGIDNARIIEIANQMPEIYQSKPALIYHGYEGDQKLEGMYDYFLELLDTSYAVLCSLKGSNSEIDEAYEKIKTFAEDR